MSTSGNSNNSVAGDKNEVVITASNPTRRTSSSPSSSPSSSSQPPDADQNKNVTEAHSEASSPGTGDSAFALYRDRAGSDSQHQNQAQASSPGPGAASGPTFSSVAAGTAFALSPSLIAGGSAAGFLTSAAAAISANNGICVSSQLTNSMSPLFGAPTSVSPSPVAAAVANAINASSNTLITNTPFVFGKGLFDRVTNGDKKDEQEVSPNGTTSNASTSTTSSGSGFVFGQNLFDRVTNQQTSLEEEVKEGNDNNGRNEAATPTVLQNATDQQFQQPGISLEPEVFGAAGNAALAHLNNTGIKVSTGEEGERNVLQMNCKLYVYDKDWIERGQGQLRLNDPARGTTGKSRLIIRTAGTLRVLLNTQIWEGIDLKPANDRKCLRLVGRDELNDHKMHVFMIKCPSQDDAANLNRSIKIRLEALRKAALEEEKATTKSEETKASTKRIIPEDEDYTPDSPNSTSLPPSTKKTHLG